MGFVLRMTWRETRASWARLLFYFVCVAIGVAAIVSLRSIVQNVRLTLTREARDLVGADIVVETQQAWTPDLRQRLDQALDAPGVLDHTELVQTQTMAQAADRKGTGLVRLVELWGLGPRYPFYGAPELAGGQSYSHSLVAGHGALVQPAFLTEFGLAVGDRVRLAGVPFTIRGVVTRDRVQGGGGIAFGPRVYVDLADLEATSLLGFGSRATYAALVRVDAAALRSETQRLRRALPRERASVRSWQSVEDRLGRNLTLAENYLSLVGFAIVVLGGIGVWSVTRVLVQQKIRSVAILKCLGASSGRVLAVYVLQVLWLAAGGSLLGIALAAAAVAAIPSSLLEPVGLTGVSVTLSAATQGTAVGMLVSLLFALVPLLEVRRVKPLLLLRADTAATARRRDWQSWSAGAAIGAVLTLVAVWQAESLRAGAYVTGGLAAVGLALYALSRVLVRAVAPLARSRHFALRHAVISLGRPGNQTRVILMAVGLGCFFILGIRALQANLLDDFRHQVARDAPDLVLIDIQPDQVAGVRQIAAPYVREPARLQPLLRARVVGVEGRGVNLPTPAAIRRQGRLTREYGLTFRNELEDNERVIAGQFWSGRLATPHTADGADTEVSIEEQVHDNAGVDVGDLMQFDVGGEILRARVTSIRKVTWDQVENGGFVFVLRPGPAMDAAPHTYIGFIDLRPDAAAGGGLQRDLVARYPNVSAIDVHDILRTLEEVVDNVTLGVTVVGAVTLLGGVLILVGAVAMTKFQRLYEAAIYRTLGASTRLLTSMVAIEYGLLGLLAGLLAAGGALVLSWVMARGLFDIDWQPAAGLLAAGVGLTAVAASLVGLAASVDVLVRKPLATLRRE
jgi:putative ABC transport system permease protein